MRIFQKLKQFCQWVINAIRGFIKRANKDTGKIIKLPEKDDIFEVGKKLAEKRQQEKSAATTIQSVVRGWAVRRQAKQEKSAATTLQRVFRGWVVRQRIQDARKAKAATTIQSLVRGWVVRRQAEQEKSAVATLQRVFRGMRARKAVIAMRLAQRKAKAAATILRHYKSHKERQIQARRAQAERLENDLGSGFASEIFDSSVMSDPNQRMREAAMQRLLEINTLRVGMYELFLPDGHKQQHERDLFRKDLGRQGFEPVVEANAILMSLQEQGVFICVYKKGSEAFIVCRGTNPSFDDRSASLNTDPIQPAYSAIESNIDQVRAAIEVVLRDRSIKKVTNIGHSLGGAKAMHMSKILLEMLPNRPFKIDLCLYNSAPFDHDHVLQPIEENLAQKTSIAMRIVDYRVRCDWVNSCVKHSPALITHASYIRFYTPFSLEGQHGKLPFETQKGTLPLLKQASGEETGLKWRSYVKAATFQANDEWYESYVGKALHAAPVVVKSGLGQIAALATKFKQGTTVTQRGALVSMPAALFAPGFGTITAAAFQVGKAIIEHQNAKVEGGGYAPD